jgi:hypothetical protein
MKATVIAAILSFTGALAVPVAQPQPEAEAAPADYSDYGYVHKRNAIILDSR